MTIKQWGGHTNLTNLTTQIMGRCFVCWHSIHFQWKNSTPSFANMWPWRADNCNGNRKCKMTTHEHKTFGIGCWGDGTTNVSMMHFSNQCHKRNVIILLTQIGLTKWMMMHLILDCIQMLFQLNELVCHDVFHLLCDTLFIQWTIHNGQWWNGQLRHLKDFGWCFVKNMARLWCISFEFEHAIGMIQWSWIVAVPIDHLIDCWIFADNVWGSSFLKQFVRLTFTLGKDDPIPSDDKHQWKRWMQWKTQRFWRELKKVSLTWKEQQIWRWPQFDWLGCKGRNALASLPQNWTTNCSSWRHWLMGRMCHNSFCVIVLF